MDLISLNWSVGVIVTFLSFIPIFFVFIFVLLKYFKERYTHLIFFTGMWFGLSIWVLFQALGDLYLSIRLHFVCFFSLPIMGYSTVLFVDSITRDSIGSWKIMLITITSTALVIFGITQPDAIIMVPHAVTPYPTMNGNFRTTVLIHTFIMVGILLYGNFIIVLKSPKSLRFLSTLNLLGTVIYGIFPILIQLLELEDNFPGISTACMAIGMIVSGITIVKEPRLAYILPVHAYELLLQDTQTGISLYSHSWKNSEKFSETLLSGMLQAVNSILDKTVNKGKVQEIRMEKALILLYRDPRTPIACILITESVTQALRNAFKAFSAFITELYLAKSPEIERTKSITLDVSSINHYFPFIPTFK